MISTKTVGVFYGFTFTMEEAQTVTDSLQELFDTKDGKLVPKDPYMESAFTSLCIREILPDTIAIYPETLTYETETFAKIVFPLPDVQHPQKGWGEAELLMAVMNWDTYPTWHVYLV